MRQRNVWVLGGTGYIGSALVRHLAADPANRLHVLIHRSAPYRALEGFNTFTGSLSAIDPLWFERYPPDVLFHLARPAGSRRITRAWASYRGEKANRRLAGLLARLEKPPVVVYVSGSLLYGPRAADDPAFEDSPLAPAAFAGYYHRNEKPWLEAQDEGLLDVRFARPAWIMGPASWFRKFFYEPMMRSGKVPYYGDGLQLMSLIHLDDCARMIDGLAFHGKQGKNLNVFSGEPLTQRHFADILANLSGLEKEQVTYAETIRRYGKTAARALTTSIPLSTHYPEVAQKAGIEFPEHDQIISAASNFKSAT